MNVKRGTTVIEFTYEESELLRKLAGRTGGPILDGKELTARFESSEEAHRVRERLLNPLFDALRDV